MLKLTKKDYKIIQQWMKEKKLSNGSGYEIIVTLFLDYYKRKSGCLKNGQTK